MVFFFMVIFNLNILLVIKNVISDKGIMISRKNIFVIGKDFLFFLVFGIISFF